MIHSGKGPIQEYTFIPSPEKPGYGLLKHRASDKFLSTSGGSNSPKDYNRVVFSSNHSNSALWRINPNRTISHADGLFWHPLNGSPNPADNNEVIVHRGGHIGFEIEGKDGVVDLYSATLL